MKPTIITTLFAAVLLSLASCGGSSSSSTSLGTLGVNGPGITGSVPTGTTRLYTLDNIVAGRNYTVRSAISTLGTDTTAPDGTLTVSIYLSEAALKSDPTNSVAVLAPDVNFPYVYEANFTATSTGNYVVAISGKSQTISDSQFFYDLRVMSASPTLPFLDTSVTSTQYASSHSVPTNLGYIHVYSGGALTLSGSYPVQLIASAVTATTAYPQLFVYNDSSLKISSLLYSSVTISTSFIITDFTSSPTGSVLPPDPNNTLAKGVTISSVPFTSGSPFIVVRGTSSASYELRVGPTPSTP